MPFATSTFLRDHRDEIVRRWRARLGGSAGGAGDEERLSALVDDLATWLEQAPLPAADARAAAERERLSEQRQLVLDAARMGWWHFAPAARVATLDERAARIFGVSGGEPLDDILKLVDPHDLPRVWAAVEAALDPADPRPYSSEYRIVRPDGEVRWIEAHGVAAFDGSGAARRATALVGTVADITERKETEHALRDSEARFRALADGTPVPIWITDPRGRVEYVNRAYLEFFGVRVAELEDRGWTPLVHPADLPAYRRAFEDAVARRVPFRAQARGRRADGAWRWMDSTGVPRFSATGEFVGMGGSSADVTEHKEAAEAIRASEGRLREILRNASAGVWEWRRGDDAYSWSDENYDLFGIRRDDPLVQRTWQDRVVPEDLPGVQAAVRAVFEARVPEFRHEFRIRHPVRGMRWILGIGQVERGPGGAPAVIRGMNLDITERKRAEEELRASDRRKSDFLAVLSHELRNPLAPIHNSLHVLEHAEPGSDTAARARDVLRRQTDHLTRLIDDLLDVTRISSGKITLQRGRIDLRDVVRKATDDLRSTFDGRGVALRADLPARPVWVDGDGTRLEQVTANLLQNAVKFTPPGGEVSVALEAAEGRATLSVRDTGAGMTAELVARLFEPFVQGAQGLARTRGGLGLGLALVKGLVEQHGGTVAARSDGPGRGAEFAVTLPLTEAAPEAPRGPADAGAAPGRLVLVVEDNADAADTLAELLALCGHRVRVARDGQSALALARALRPDVILCDIGLPDLDGYEVARALRRDPALAGARLVALTGYAQPEDRDRAGEAGFDGHLAKPPRIEELEAILAAAPARGAGR